MASSINDETHPADDEIAQKLEAAIELMRQARLEISDASICIEADGRGSERHGHTPRELTQVQSHLQLGIIQLSEIKDDYGE